MKKAQKKVPKPVKTESRICFGLAWFETEAEAETYAAFVRARGDRYNGGWFDGMPCGRAKQFDYSDSELGCRLYAVSTS